jgi:carbohydrate-binding DOMON domain-containing protein
MVGLLTPSGIIVMVYESITDNATVTDTETVTDNATVTDTETMPITEIVTTVETEVFNISITEFITDNQTITITDPNQLSFINPINAIFIGMVFIYFHYIQKRHKK